MDKKIAKLACVKCMSYRSRYPELEEQTCCETCKYFNQDLIYIFDELRKIDNEKIYEEE